MFIPSKKFSSEGNDEEEKVGQLFQKNEGKEKIDLDESRKPFAQLINDETAHIKQIDMGRTKHKV